MANEQPVGRARRSALAALLSFNGGFVDTAGFLGWQGLFTAHVTGNFVTLAATLVMGTHGVIAKLLALPEFVVIVALARLAGSAMRTRGVPALPILLAAMVGFLLAFFALAVTLGPFPDSDAPAALLAGFAGVAGMAVQNAVQRVHLTNIPPTTLMTGNTAQAVLDAVDLIWGVKAEDRTGRPFAPASRARYAALSGLPLGVRSQPHFIIGWSSGVSLCRWLLARQAPFCRCGWWARKDSNLQPDASRPSSATPSLMPAASSQWPGEAELVTIRVGQMEKPFAPFGVARRGVWIVAGRKHACMESVHVGMVKDNASPPRPNPTGRLGDEIEIAGSGPKAREFGVIAAMNYFKSEHAIEAHGARHVVGCQGNGTDALDHRGDAPLGPD